MFDSVNVKFSTNSPGHLCLGCQEKHNEFFWHCATELTFGTLATCNRCKYEVDNAKETSRKTRREYELRRT